MNIATTREQERTHTDGVGFNQNVMREAGFRSAGCGKSRRTGNILNFIARSEICKTSDDTTDDADAAALVAEFDKGLRAHITRASSRMSPPQSLCADAVVPLSGSRKYLQKYGRCHSAKGDRKGKWGIQAGPNRVKRHNKKKKTVRIKKRTDLPGAKSLFR